jgi:uncharacterized protein
VNQRAHVNLLPDGRRLHLHDGPIDLIIQASGFSLEQRFSPALNASFLTPALAAEVREFGFPATPPKLPNPNAFGKGTTSVVPSRDLPDWALAPEVCRAYRAAAARFVTILDELCTELPLLRQPAKIGCPQPHGIIAKRMMAAVLPHCRQNFITPMAAVAGAVAEEILNSMTRTANLSRAYVNNGGDIALHLAPGEHFTIGMVERPDRPSLFGKLKLDSTHPIRGIATSGWRGRSFSLGIADAVTVLAHRAATADAAATIIANAVDLPGHPNITRVPANHLAPDSDLGDRLVTQYVGELSPCAISTALDSALAVAESLISQGLIHSAALRLQGETRLVGVLDRGSQHPTALRAAKQLDTRSKMIVQTGSYQGTASAVPPRANKNAGL